MVRKILAAGAVVLIVALTAGALATTVLPRGGGPTLTEGLRQTIDVVESTVAIAAPTRLTTPRPDNAQVTKAKQLRNNHSFSDHSNSTLYPGYNDCDSWKNVVADGWSASYGVEIPVSGEQDAQQLVKQTKQYWESRGLDVKTQTMGDPSTGSSFTRIWTSTGFARFQMNIDRGRGVVSLIGMTNCLPPN